MFEDKQKSLIEGLDEAHQSYYGDDEIFGGPSLHFHYKSLEAAEAGNRELFADYVYAALVAWQMNHPGRNGAPMRDFKTFNDSLNSVWPLALGLREKSPENLTDEDRENLKEIFTSLNCMRTKPILVANSKVMAHLLPNLIPPVDRRYTLQFLFGNSNIENDHEEEWKKLRQILDEFFYPIWQHPVFQAKFGEWEQKKNEFPWDTSRLKTIDNLIIGLMVGPSKSIGKQPPLNKPL